jgi:hypothetical protein
MPDVE